MEATRGSFFHNILRNTNIFSLVKMKFHTFLKKIFFHLAKSDMAYFPGKPMSITVLYVDSFSSSESQSNVEGRINAYKKIGTLVTFDYRKLAAKFGAYLMNRILLYTAEKYRPDIIQLGKSESIKGSTIATIRSRINTCVVHFYGDFRWEPQPWVIDIGKYADLTLFYHKEQSLIQQYIERGVKHPGYWCVGTDPDIFYPRQTGKILDLVFMANNYSPTEWGERNERLEFVDTLAKKGFNLHIYGKNWHHLSRFSNIHIHHFVDLDRFADICSSAKITLGINAANNVKLYASWRRIFNSMACGAFHLTRYVPGLEEIFENNKHLAWFHSIPEAIDLINYYLIHNQERERIASAGREEVFAHHTWDARIAELIKMAKTVKNDTDFSVRMKPWEKWESEWSQERIDSIWRVKAESKSWRKDRAYSIIAEKCREYGRSVIDIGCGGGIQYAALREIAPHVSYIGVDITPKMLSIARHLFPDVQFVLGDAANLPYPNNNFDVAIVRHVFEHHPLENGKLILHEALRLAKYISMLLFFIEPQDIESDIVEQEDGGFYKNIYSKSWLIREIKAFLLDQCEIETISIPQTHESPAYTDQFLFVIKKYHV